MLILFPIIFGLISIVIFVFIIRYIIITVRCSRWPVVIGEVISAEMKAKYKKLAEFMEAAHTVTSLYQPDITYEYQINGEKFTNNRVRPVGRNVWKKTPVVQRVLNLYPKGSNVQIFYNPANPSDSVLDPYIRFSPLAITIPTAIIFLGLGFSLSGNNMLFGWGTNLISYALYTASVLIFVQNIRYLVKVLKSKKWPYVEGEIEGVQIYRKASRKGSTRKASYNVDITYTYYIEEQKYMNHQIKLDIVHGARTFVPKLFAMMKMERYEEGKKVNVYYNPLKPYESILKHGLRIFTFIIMIITAVGLFILGFFAIPAMINAITTS